jgi:hypothetical protein
LVKSQKNHITILTQITYIKSLHQKWESFKNGERIVSHRMKQIEQINVAEGFSLPLWKPKGYQLNTLTSLGTYLRSGEPEGSPLHMHKGLDVGVELQLHPNQIPTL